MKDIVRILLISLLSFTIISCSAKDESESSSGSSSGSSMKLSDIQANFNNKTDFIVGEKQSTNSGRNLVTSFWLSSTQVEFCSNPRCKNRVII